MQFSRFLTKINVLKLIAIVVVVAAPLIAYGAAYGWEALTHMIDRQLIHVFAGPGIYWSFLFGVWTLERRVSWWPSLTGWTALVTPAFLALFVVLAWEMWDGRLGGSSQDPPIKSIIDVFVGWLVGLTGGVIAAYRSHPYVDRAVGEINRRRYRRV